jgi:hypothetical protein
MGRFMGCNFGTDIWVVMVGCLMGLLIYGLIVNLGWLGLILAFDEDLGFYFLIPRVCMIGLVAGTAIERTASSDEYTLFFKVRINRQHVFSLCL